MLGINPDKVCHIIVKAREFDVKEAPMETDVGSNPSDDGVREILADHADDPTYEELKTFLDDLNEEEIVTLLALVWLGRGDYTVDEWDAIVKEAQEIADEKAPNYLLGFPLLADFLEEGLSQLGYSCQDFEMGRL
jgi:hypothetical protein